MKKISLFVLTVTLLALTTLSVNAKMVGFGISAGSSHANYSIKGYDGVINNNSGFQAGASVSVHLPIVSVTPEVWYSQNNFEVNDASIMGGYGKVTSRAVDMPIVVGLSLFGPLQIELGPSFSLYDNAKADFLIGDSADLGHVRSAVGYVAGAKLTIAKKFIIGARFNGQFGGRENDFGRGTTYDVRNYSYSFSLGFNL